MTEITIKLRELSIDIEALVLPFFQDKIIEAIK